MAWIWWVVWLGILPIQLGLSARLAILWIGRSLDFTQTR